MAGLPDERETRFLEYQNIFIGCVKNAQLCIELSSLLRDEGEHIKRLYDIEPRKASEKLADAIIKSQDLGKWTELQRALTRSGFPYLIELLSGKKAHSEEEKRIIDLFASKLLDHINPTEIISQLLADDVITESDKQEILTRYDTKGSMAATILLLDNVQIHLPPKEWYRKFLTALLHNGHGDLVDEIDPDFNNCQRKACPGSDTDDTCNKAPMEVETNTPCWSSDNS